MHFRCAMKKQEPDGTRSWKDVVRDFGHANCASALRPSSIVALCCPKLESSQQARQYDRDESYVRWGIIKRESACTSTMCFHGPQKPCARTDTGVGCWSCAQLLLAASTARQEAGPSIELGCFYWRLILHQ